MSRQKIAVCVMLCAALAATLLYSPVGNIFDQLPTPVIRWNVRNGGLGAAFGGYFAVISSPGTAGGIQTVAIIR